MTDQSTLDKRWNLVTWILIFISLVGIPICWLIGKADGLYGYLLGCFLSTFTWAFLKGLTFLMAKSAENQPPPRLGLMLTITGFVLKVPILLFALYLMQQLDEPGPPCLAAGILLVYSAATAWGLSGYQRKKTNVQPTS